MAKGMRNFKAKGVTGLAWANLAIALTGGALAVDTWVGQVAVWFIQVPPWEWFPPVLLAALVIAVGLDLFLDGVPNQMAIIGALAAPSVAAASPGKLGATVTEWAGSLLGWLDGELIGWLGTSSATGLAIGCIVASILMSRRVVRKSKGKATATTQAA